MLSKPGLPLIQRMTILSLVLMGIVMLWLSGDFSMSGDEASQIQIGRNIHVYLGRSLGFIPGETHSIKLDNYGALFGVISTGLTHLFPNSDEIRIRHLMIAITGLFAIFYAGRTARLLHGGVAELLTIWMLFCSPRFFGASMNDSKDIPFALGMIMSTYFLLRITRDAPIIIPRHFLGLCVGLFIAVGVRIGGLMFGLYALIAFAWLTIRHWRNSKAYIIRLGIWLLGVAITAFFAAIIFLPFVWPHIILGTLKALQKFSNYYVALTMLYQGQDLPTSEPPWHYLPVWIGITIPVIVLLLFLVSPVMLRRKLDFPALLLVFTILFPWLSIVIGHSPVYDAWRQFYFIYPPIVVLAGMCAAEIISLMKTPMSKALVATSIGICLLPPLVWSARNHPLENVYFNEIAGGVDGAYGKYETDYYGEGTERACKKLLQQGVFRRPLSDSVYVLNNIPTQINYYLKKHDPKIVTMHMSYEKRDSVNWDFGIFYTRGLDSLLKRKDWPPAGMIDSVVAEHTILMAIVKNPRR